MNRLSSFPAHGPRVVTPVRSLPFWICLFGLAGAWTARAQSHPLDPLTSAEITVISWVLQADGRVQPAHQYPEITLREPPKSEVLAWRPGSPFRREAVALVLDLPANRLHEVVVDLRARRVL